MDVKVTPKTIRERKAKLPTLLPGYAEKVLRWNDREIRRHWRKVIKPEKY